MLRLAQHEIAVQFSSQSIGYKFVMSLNVFRRNWFKIQCRGIDTFKIARVFSILVSISIMIKQNWQSALNLKYLGT